MLIALSFLVFGCAHIVPGGVCSLEPLSSRSQCATNLGVGQSLPQQYFHWLAATFGGTIGQTAVGPGLWSRILGGLPPTTVLFLAAYGLLAFASWLRVFFARSTSRLSRPAGYFGFLGAAVPTVLLGLALLYVLAFSWPVFPSGAIASPNIHAFWSSSWFSQVASEPRIVIVNLIKHLVLPVITLSAFLSLFDDLGAGRTGLVIQRALAQYQFGKAEPTRPGLFRATFNAALPMCVGSAWKLAAALVSGSLVVESVFQFSGLGLLFSSSLASRDFATALALIVVSSMTLIFLDTARFHWMGNR